MLHFFYENVSVILMYCIPTWYLLTQISFYAYVTLHMGLFSEFRFIHSNYVYVYVYFVYV